MRPTRIYLSGVARIVLNRLIRLNTASARSPQRICKRASSSVAPITLTRMTTNDEQMLKPELMASIESAQQAVGSGSDMLRAALTDALGMARRARHL